jgi:hypothetical protein
LIQTAGYFVFCEKSCCLRSLKNQLNTNDKITFRIIGILQGLEILSSEYTDFRYKSLVSNLSELEDKLDLLFKLHQMKYPN